MNEFELIFNRLLDSYIESVEGAERNEISEESYAQLEEELNSC